MYIYIYHQPSHIFSDPFCQAAYGRIISFAPEKNKGILGGKPSSVGDPNRLLDTFDETPPPPKKKQPSQQKNALVQGSTLTSPPKKQGNLQVYLKQILKKWSKIEKILVNVTSVAHLDENLYSERNGSI